MRHIVPLTLLAIAAQLCPVQAQPTQLQPDPLRYVAPSRDFDVIHTRLELDLDLRAQRIAGSVTHTLRPIKADLETIRLNCVDLEVSAVQIDRRSVDFEHPVPGERTPSWFQHVDAGGASDELHVFPGRPLDADAEFDLTIQYEGAPKQGLYFMAPERGIPEQRYEVWSQGEGEDTRYWVPTFDFPNDKATFEGMFRVAKGNYVLSNGALVERRDEGDKTVFHWRLGTPQVSYLIMVAAAEYEVFEDTAAGVPLLYVVPPGTERATVDRCYGLTGDMMEFFTDYIGIDYPFEKYAQVVVQNFIYGGMENTTATVMNMRTLFSERRGLTDDEQNLIAHELAHQWWGDMVTCADWSHMWLNEGFSTYFNELYRRHHQGDDDFRYDMDRLRREFFTKDTEVRPLVVDFFNRRDGKNSANVYRKGAWTLHMLNFILGEDMFRKVMHEYGERFKFQTATTYDFIKTVRDVSGENLDWFFEQWAYCAGYPALTVSKAWDAEANTLRLAIRQTQETTGLTPLFRLPMDVEITTDEGTSLHRIVVERGSHDFYFHLPSRPKMVIVDKGDWTLKTLAVRKLPDELIYQLRNADTMSRVRAARALGETTSSDRIAAALEEVMTNTDEFWGLRYEAAVALGKQRSPESRAALLAATSVENARVRLGVAEGLGKVQLDDEVSDALYRLFKRDPAYQVQAAALTSLVGQEAKRAKRACLEGLDMDADREYIRTAALDGLVKMRATDALDKIEKLTTAGNPHEFRRQPAIRAYALLAKQLARESERERAADHLTGMLDDWYLKTRAAVVAALQDLGEPRAIEPLRDVAVHDPVASIRTKAVHAIAAIETGQDDIATRDALEARIELLTEQIETLQRDLRTLQRRAPSEADDRITQKEE